MSLIKSISGNEICDQYARNVASIAAYSGASGNNLFCNQYFNNGLSTLGCGLVTDQNPPRGGNCIVIAGRDHFDGNIHIPQIIGHRYRMQIDIKDKSGQGFPNGHGTSPSPSCGVWYTTQTSGAGYDGFYRDTFVSVKDLGNGWFEETYEFTLTNNKKQSFSPFIQIETSNAYPSGKLQYYISNLRLYDVSAALKITDDGNGNVTMSTI